MIFVSAIGVLADGAPRNTGPDFGKASPLGLLVIVLLLLGTVFLIRSMNRQLKKVPDSFDRENPGPDQAADEGTIAVDDAAGEPSDEASHTAVDQPVDKAQDTQGDGARADRNGSPHEPDG